MDTRTQDRSTSITSARTVDLVANVVALAIGAWLLVAPFGVAMDFTADEAATWSTMLAGGVAIAGGIGAFMRVAGSAAGYALAGLAGVWLVLAPYVLSFDGGSGSDPAINSIISGIAIATFSLLGYAARTTSRVE